MEQENKTTVTISLSEYVGLIQCASDFENLRKALYMSAKLNYNKTGLRFDDDVISMMLGVTDGERYERKLQQLKEEETES